MPQRTTDAKQSEQGLCGLGLYRYERYPKNIAKVCGLGQYRYQEMSNIGNSCAKISKKNSKAMSPRYQKNSKCASGKKDSKEIAQQLLKRYQKAQRGKHGRSSPNYNFLISCSVSLQSKNPICSPSVQPVSHSGPIDIDVIGSGAELL